MKHRKPSLYGIPESLNWSQSQCSASVQPLQLALVSISELSNKQTSSSAKWPESIREKTRKSFLHKIWSTFTKISQWSCSGTVTSEATPPKVCWIRIDDWMCWHYWLEEMIRQIFVMFWVYSCSMSSSQTSSQKTKTDWSVWRYEWFSLLLALIFRLNMSVWRSLSIWYIKQRKVLQLWTVVRILTWEPTTGRKWENCQNKRTKCPTGYNFQATV